AAVRRAAPANRSEVGFEIAAIPAGIAFDPHVTDEPFDDLDRDHAVFDPLRPDHRTREHVAAPAIFGGDLLSEAEHLAKRHLAPQVRLGKGIERLDRNGARALEADLPQSHPQAAVGRHALRLDLGQVDRSGARNFDLWPKAFVDPAWIDRLLGHGAR